MADRRQEGWFALRKHTADVAVEATGPTLGAAFAAAADGLAAAQCETVPDGGERFDIDVSAESREALLFDYLDELIYRRDVEQVLPVENEAVVASPRATSAGGDPARPRTRASDEGTDEDDWHVEASARGVPVSTVNAREVKAVTYSEMAIRPTDDDDGWSVYVVLDV